MYTHINGRQEMCADENVSDVERRFGDGHDQKLKRIRFPQNNPERNQDGGAGKPSFENSENV